MEPNLSDYEVHKERLKHSTEDLKKALEVEIDRVRENASEWGKVILIAGGTLLLTYTVVRSFRKSKTKKYQTVEQAYYPAPVKQSNLIAKRIFEHIAFFVLGMVKQKLVEYLEQRKNHEKNDS
jgi:hypothetical protein